MTLRDSNDDVKKKSKPMRESATLEGFEFVEGAGPIFAQEAGEAAVGKDLAAGLASGAVVGLVVSVADALDFFSAAGAGVVKLAVDGEFGAECGDAFGEGFVGFPGEAVGPDLEGGAGCGEEAGPLFVGELGGEGYG